MVESGLIPHDRRVYLERGRLFEKMAKSKAHGYVGAAINRSVARRLSENWSLWPESTIKLDAANAPLPDFAVIRCANPLDFASPARYPEASDVGLIIEVAMTSLQADLTHALDLYARFLIPVYWVVDIAGGRVLVHSVPKVVEGVGEYTRVEIYRSGDSIPLVLDGEEITKIAIEEFLRLS